MSSINPKIIVITPVRNEAWVLDAFLTCTSSWADYIIIADQHSTDGSREIAKKYSKVILHDNPNEIMNQAQVRRFLFQEADRIKGEKIIFALDADEFLSAGFEKTNGWKRIMNSSRNELFCFRWLNIYDDFSHAVPLNNYMEWACHLDNSMNLAETYWACEKRAVHEMRVPCLPVNQVDYIMISDIRFVHLANLNKERQRNKFDFYQVHTLTDLKKKSSAVSMFRQYYPHHPEILSFTEEISLIEIIEGNDVKSLVKRADHGMHYVDEMVQIFEREGYDRFIKLNIWDNPYLIERGINPYRSVLIRLLHWYLNHTDNSNWEVGCLDKVLKRLY